MSQKGGQEYNILSQAKFSEHCSVLNCKELSCYDPDKKAIERAFRKRALKTHPDKGGDPIEFKKINDSYNRLIGHIGKLESQAEENELANSILIEISKTAVPQWIEKLKRVYGWHKSSDCKCIILEGPYKQFKGRSKNTGPITLVLYEDPPDGIPKIHVRSLKYMAWIAEQMLPVYMHVEKGRQIQFNQWRIAHIAEFGIIAHKTVIPTPAPQRKAQPEAPKETPKRKARDGSARRPKARRDSEPTETSADSKNAKPKDTATDKENKEPDNVATPKASEKNGKADDFNPDEWEEIPEDTKDPFPKLYNMADQAFTKNGKKYRRKENKTEEPVKEKPKFASMVFNCGHCGAGFNSMIDYSSHSKICIPDEDFGLAKDSEKPKPSVTVSSASIPEPKETKTPLPEDIRKATDVPVKESENGSDRSFDFLTGMSSTPARKSPDQPSFSCNDCNYGSESLKEYTKHKSACDKPPEVQKQKNVDDELKDGKIIGKPAAKNNSEIPDTHSFSTDKKENIVPNEKKLDSNLSSKTNEHSNETLTEKDSLKNNVSKPPKAPKGNRKSSDESQPETTGKPLQNGKADIININDKSKNIHMDSLKHNLPPSPTKNSEAGVPDGSEMKEETKHSKHVKNPKVSKDEEGKTDTKSTSSKFNADAKVSNIKSSNIQNAEYMCSAAKDHESKNEIPINDSKNTGKSKEVPEIKPLKSNLKPENSSSTPKSEKKQIKIVTNDIESLKEMKKSEKSKLKTSKKKVDISEKQTKIVPEKDLSKPIATLKIDKKSELKDSKNNVAIVNTKNTSTAERKVSDEVRHEVRKSKSKEKVCVNKTNEKEKEIKTKEVKDQNQDSQKNKEISDKSILGIDSNHVTETSVSKDVKRHSSKIAEEIKPRKTEEELITIEGKGTKLLDHEIDKCLMNKVNIGDFKKTSEIVNTKTREILQELKHDEPIINPPSIPIKSQGNQSKTETSLGPSKINDAQNTERFEVTPPNPTLIIKETKTNSPVSIKNEVSYIPSNKDKPDSKLAQNHASNGKTFIESLDTEAIRLSNDIFNFADSDIVEELTEVRQVHDLPDSDTPKTKTKYIHGHQRHSELNTQTSLDHEAIKLSNDIFSENTKMSVEEMQSTDDKIKQKKDSLNEVSKEYPVQSQPSTKSNIGNNTINTKELNRNIPKNDGKSRSAMLSEDLNKPERYHTRTKSNLEEQDLDLRTNRPSQVEIDHKNRPACLGGSRFGYIDNSQSYSAKPPSGSSTQQQKPVRNATFSNIPSSEHVNPIAQSSSFAFDSKAPLSPRTQRRQFDSNFNAHPVPFNSSKYNVHFYDEPEPKYTSKPPTSLSSSPESNSRFSRFSSATTSILQGMNTYKKSSNSSQRAKSEGSYITPSEKPYTTYANHPSSLIQKIQASKDQHREHFSRATNYDKEYKPVVINPKLPRPSKDYSRFSNYEQDKMTRRQERERTVIDRVLSDRVSRATSLDNPYKL